MPEQGRRQQAGSPRCSETCLRVTELGGEGRCAGLGRRAARNASHKAGAGPVVPFCTVQRDGAMQSISRSTYSLPSPGPVLLPLPLPTTGGESKLSPSALSTLLPHTDGCSPPWIRINTMRCSRPFVDGCRVFPDRNGSGALACNNPSVAGRPPGEDARPPDIGVHDRDVAVGDRKRAVPGRDTRRVIISAGPERGDPARRPYRPDDRRTRPTAGVSSSGRTQACILHVARQDNLRQGTTVPASPHIPAATPRVCVPEENRFAGQNKLLAPRGRWLSALAVTRPQALGGSERIPTGRLACWLSVGRR